MIWFYIIFLLIGVEIYCSVESYRYNKRFIKEANKYLASHSDTSQGTFPPGAYYKINVMNSLIQTEKKTAY